MQTLISGKIANNYIFFVYFFVFVIVIYFSTSRVVSKIEKFRFLYPTPGNTVTGSLFFA